MGSCKATQEANNFITNRCPYMASIDYLFGADVDHFTQWHFSL